MSPRRPALAAVTLAALLGAAASPAQTQSPQETARQLYAAGGRAFAERRYADAVRAFREAHAITHRPELLYNLGLAQSAAGDPAGAVESLSLFRDAGAPGLADRAALDRQIDELRQAAEERARRPADVPPPPPRVEVVERRIIEPRWIRVEYRYERSALDAYGPWVTLGLGAALATVGVAMGVSAAGHASTASGVNAGDTPWSADAASAFDAGPTSVALAWAFGAAGGAAVAGGALWLALRGPGARREVPVTASVAPAPGGVAFALGGSL